MLRKFVSATKGAVTFAALANRNKRALLVFPAFLFGLIPILQMFDFKQRPADCVMVLIGMQVVAANIYMLVLLQGLMKETKQ